VSRAGGQPTTVEGRLRHQSDACGYLGSRLYEGLLRRAAEDYEAEGPTRRVLEGHEGDPGGSALALRLMGASQRLALEGAAPELAEVYASTDRDEEREWEAFRAVLEQHRERLRALVELPVQTNEVGRCAALLPGFLAVARETELPLRLLEVGASAGLNLLWDEYRYEAEGFEWGGEEAPLTIGFELRGGAIAGGDVDVDGRAGCDSTPVDPRTEDGRLTLLSYCWPDQAERMGRLRSALDLAARQPRLVERAEGAAWAAARLAEPAPGKATVLFHSVVMQYLGDDERERFEDTVRDAGGTATAEAPFAWLRMEPDGDRAEVRLTIWPGGEDRRLLRAGYHGTPVELSP
jgi:hypothetical protein